tara:strand:- start:3366 stop:4508 length:1143 start_codon:yes stop_codon:yes gene_type:complete
MFVKNFRCTRRGLRLRSVPAIFVALILISVAATTASAQVPTNPPGVEIECGDDPLIDVHPQRYEPAVVQCTITNPSSFEETVSLESEWDGVEVTMTMSEDELTIAAGEEETIDLTFAKSSSNSKLTSDLSWDYEIEAKVMQVQGIPWDNFGANASTTGDVRIAEYGMVELVIDRGMKTVEANTNFNLSFYMENKGNANDMITVSVANTGELEAAGFSFPQTSFVKEDVMVNGQSSVRQIDFRTPSGLEDDLEITVVLEASSGNDDLADIDRVTINLLVEPESTSVGGVDISLSSVSTNDLIMYGYIGGAFLLFIFLLLIITRIGKRRRQKAELFYDVEDEEDVSYQTETIVEDEFDEFDEFDDMFSDISDDDLEAGFADL